MELAFLSAIPWKTIGIGAIAAVIRNLGGWFENACDEASEGGRKITPYELAQLGSTTVRVVIMTVAVYLPLQAFGLEAAGLAAAGSAVALDFLLKAIKKQKKIVLEEEETTEEKK